MVLVHISFSGSYIRNAVHQSASWMIHLRTLRQERCLFGSWAVHQQLVLDGTHQSPRQELSILGLYIWRVVHQLFHDCIYYFTLSRTFHLWDFTYRELYISLSGMVHIRLFGIVHQEACTFSSSWTINFKTSYHSSVVHPVGRYVRLYGLSIWMCGPICGGCALGRLRGYAMARRYATVFISRLTAR